MPYGDYDFMQLGPVTLIGFELPKRIGFGGEQQIIVNKFVGMNKREVHLLGAQPRPIEWEGVFLYFSAVDRAKFFDSLRVKGDPLSFMWGDFNYNVVITKFSYDPVNAYNIPYQIVLEIVQDLTDLASVAGFSVDITAIPDGIVEILSLLSGLFATIQLIIAKSKISPNPLPNTVTSELNSIVGLGNHLVTDVTAVVHTIYSQPEETLNSLKNDSRALS